MICAVCSKDQKWLEKHANEFECSHVECPNRKPVTARLSGGMATQLNYAPMELRAGKHYQTNPRFDE